MLKYVILTIASLVFVLIGTACFFRTETILRYHIESRNKFIFSMSPEEVDAAVKSRMNQTIARTVGILCFGAAALLVFGLYWKRQ
jgi:hypothetical protein